VTTRPGVEFRGALPFLPLRRVAYQAHAGYVPERTLMLCEVVAVDEVAPRPVATTLIVKGVFDAHQSNVAPEALELLLTNHSN